MLMMIIQVVITGHQTQNYVNCLILISPVQISKKNQSTLMDLIRSSFPEKTVGANAPHAGQGSNIFSK